MTGVQTCALPILQTKTTENDGYVAIQVGFDEKREKNTTKPLMGIFNKAGVKPQRFVKEFRVESVDAYALGQELKVDILANAEFVDITGTSKGKGTAGVMKRHNFGGNRATHGVSRNHRLGGSIGNSSTPGEVYKGRIEIISETYNPAEFFDTIHNYEDKTEGGSRCSLCYHMRFKKAAEKAKEENFDYFGSVLTISPHKNAERINLIGANLEKIYNIKFLYSDFKRNNGFKRSLEISKEHDLYRQQYCGCSFSIRNKAECL